MRYRSIIQVSCNRGDSHSHGGVFMKQVSIFNNVLGPVMRGPSSSHTAGSYHIGSLVRSLLGEEIKEGCITFDADGSYGKMYQEQGSDLAFVSGLLGWDMLDERFHDALTIAPTLGTNICFKVDKIPHSNHPNWVEIDVRGASGQQMRFSAQSIGGGSIVLSNVDGWDLSMTGDCWEIFVFCSGVCPEGAHAELTEMGGHFSVIEGPKGILLRLKRPDRLSAEQSARLQAWAAPDVRIREIPPLLFPQIGAPLFQSAAELLIYANERGISLGHAGLEYEMAFLGLSRQEAMDEMYRRHEIMKGAAQRGLAGKFKSPMQLLEPTAHKIFNAQDKGSLPFGTFHTRAAARAMAIMHANGAMEVVCAAPTGGAAGALPGAVITLEEELSLNKEQVCLALFAAGMIGVLLDTRATFAAEVAGCQVEIGAGGAMASAAAIEACGGSVAQALDAAAISFQNTMGSVCDLVQGIVELPCHTRNALAASSAFVNADLILGGYENPVPLDETIDAVYSVGKMLPPQLRCTSLGGLALCPSALAMRKKR